ncbi:hypothetical protein IAE57_13045 [Stenotrophomonas sp. S48]|uniref:hypothetical protein n=1 Tax=unclassified Stenotrophomonas TaxID=196198 RepID=UPI0018FF8FA9|nr:MULTISPECIES: hypothetical protein [unclassified Stenotrophomonas]MBK0027094.1 hypothetical protein [Stenotrophomonas sp. S48]MBK0049176.1 hypothetical protein [Stenotrophomonas sp. S49]
MHNENPFPSSTDSVFATGRVDCQSTREEQPTNGRLYRGEGEEQPTNGRLYQSQNQNHSHKIDLQRQRARRTALWVGAIAVLVYVGFILSGVIGR